MKYFLCVLNLGHVEAKWPAHRLLLHCGMMIYSVFSLNGQWINNDILMYCISEHSMCCMLLCTLCHNKSHSGVQNCFWAFEKISSRVLSFVLRNLNLKLILSDPFTRCLNKLRKHSSQGVLVDAWVWISLCRSSLSPHLSVRFSFLLTVPMLHNQMPGEAESALYACQHWSAG